MLSIFKKSQKRNKKASGSEQTVQLVLTIRRAIVVVVLGLYGDSNDHTATSIRRAGNTKHELAVQYKDGVWHRDEEAGDGWGTSSIETRKSLPEANATTPGRYTYPASYSVIAFLSDFGID